MAFKKIKEVIEVSVKGANASNRSLKELDQQQDKASRSANRLESGNKRLGKTAEQNAKSLDRNTAANRRSQKQQEQSLKATDKLKKSMQGLGQALTAAGGAAQAFGAVSSAVTNIGRTLTLRHRGSLRERFCDGENAHRSGGR